jgi:Na+/melibiose symporter-like transporter
MTIFLDELIPITDTQLIRPTNVNILKTVILSASALLPHFLVVLCTSLLQRFGLFWLLHFLFSFKITFSICIFWIFYFLFELDFSSSTSLLLLLLYILCAKVFNEVICRHGNLVLADIVDEDNYTYNRSISMSSLVFGVNAFFTKPGQSLAPMFGKKMISYYGTGQSNLGVTPRVIFCFMTGVPIACGTIQLILWSFYTLHSNYLETVKSSRKVV